MSFLTRLQKALSSLKQQGVQLSLKAIINRRIKKVGTMTRIEIDPRNKTVNMELDLKGETAPIVIKSAEYALTKTDEGTFIEFKELSASREWLTVVLNEYVAGRPLPIPSAAAVAL